MRGPLPQENRRRRNAPAVPTTNLPVAGRVEDPPALPDWQGLGEAGQSWWLWAWRTPQACAWGPGHEAVVARRASLEDDLAIMAEVDSLDFGDVLDAESAAKVRAAVQRLAAIVSGRLQVMREMRELDDRLGLTPKGMAALRWKFVEDGEGPAAAGEKPAARYGHLKAVAGGEAVEGA